MFRLIQFLKRAIRLNASAILFVSVSAAGVDRLDEPKLDSNSAKKRLSTCLCSCFQKVKLVSNFNNMLRFIHSQRGPIANRVCCWFVGLLWPYHQVANHDSGQEEWNTRHIAHQHAVPHRLNPFAAQHAKHDHEGVHEIGEIPAWQIAVRKAVHVVCICDGPAATVNGKQTRVTERNQLKDMRLHEKWRLNRMKDTIHKKPMRSENEHKKKHI